MLREYYAQPPCNQCAEIRRYLAVSHVMKTHSEIKLVSGIETQ